MVLSQIYFGVWTEGYKSSKKSLELFYIKCDHYSREETIQGRKLLNNRRFLLRKLFKGGKYSRAETIRGNTVSCLWHKTTLLFSPIWGSFYLIFFFAWSKDRVQCCGILVLKSPNLFKILKAPQNAFQSISKKS